MLVLLNKIRLFAFYVIWIFALALVCGCGQESSQDHSSEVAAKQDAATIDMANKLQSIYNSISPQKNTFSNMRRAEFFLQQSNTNDMFKRTKLRLRSSFEFINAGLNEKAISILDEVEAELSNIQFDTKYKLTFDLKGLRAIANFRKGELDNCRDNHNESSCILPLQEQAVHQLTAGSANAIKDIQDILEIKRDPNFVYLLNVAYMTLGQYPQGVPDDYLVPLTMKEDDMLNQPLINVGSSVGIDHGELSGGVIIDDFSGDGIYDIIVSSWSLNDDIAYYVADGKGGYQEHHVQSGLKGITGGLNIEPADYDNDGDLDFIILRGAWIRPGKYPNSLIRNNGDNTFSDVTIESGIYSENSTQTAAWADFNNDGHLDIFIGNESLDPNNPQKSELFLNDGNGHFDEVSDSIGLNITAFVKGVSATDIDNDGDQDLFVSVMGGQNKLYRNDSSVGPESIFSFSDISSIAGIELPLLSFATWFFDYDNDGLEDLFVASYPSNYYNNLAAEYLNELTDLPHNSEYPRLYKNQGGGHFEDVTLKVQLDKVCFTMGSSYGDIDNDGFLDIYLGTGEPDLKAVIPNRAFLNDSGQKFREVTTQAGLGHLQKGHGVSFADLDNDGDQDIYAVMGGAYEGDRFFNALFENPGYGNDFLKLKLEGGKSNKMAMGARVEVILESGRSLHRRISSGSSFGNNPRTLEIGIPKGNNIEEIKVIWPSGYEELHSDIQTNKSYLISEAKMMKPIEITPIPLIKNNTHHHHHH